MRTYTLSTFLTAVAGKTQTPVMGIATSGMGASSMRYRDIAVPEDAQKELQVSGIAFLTFNNVEEGNRTFNDIVKEFPESGQTTLSIEVALAVPGKPNSEMRQIHGEERMHSLSA